MGYVFTFSWYMLPSAFLKYFWWNWWITVNLMEHMDVVQTLMEGSCFTESLSAVAQQHSVVTEAKWTCLQVRGAGATPSLCSAAHSRGTDTRWLSAIHLWAWLRMSTENNQMKMYWSRWNQWHRQFHSCQYLKARHLLNYIQLQAYDRHNMSRSIWFWSGGPPFCAVACFLHLCVCAHI